MMSIYLTSMFLCQQRPPAVTVLRDLVRTIRDRPRDMSIYTDHGTTALCDVYTNVSVEFVCELEVLHTMQLAVHSLCSVYSRM